MTHAVSGHGAGREEVCRHLSHEIARRLDIYVDLLERWQGTINLIAPSTLPDVWTRHIADSLQVHAAVPSARRWIDLGSGGGFPGLVTALVLADFAGTKVHLVESDKRKAAFLRTVARETGAPALVHAQRIETFVPAYDASVDAISARALAPLPQLLRWSEKLLEDGAIGVFQKGETADRELTALATTHRFTVETVPSALKSGSRLVIVRAAGLRSAGGLHLSDEPAGSLTAETDTCR